jgi:hypothetical protein
MAIISFGDEGTHRKSERKYPVPMKDTRLLSLPQQPSHFVQSLYWPLPVTAVTIHSKV